MKKLICVLTVMCLLVNVFTVPVMAKKLPKVYVGYDFNSYATNAKPEGIETVGKNVRVVSDGKNNKLLTTELADGYANISCELPEITGDFAVSFDINYNGLRPSMSNVSIVNANSKSITLLSVENGSASSYNGYRIKGIKSKGMVNVTIVCSSRFNAQSIYIDGKSQIKNWKLKSSDSISNPSKLQFEFVDEIQDGVSISLDNIYVYSTNKYLNTKSFVKSTYNPEETVFVPDADSTTDFVYVSENFNQRANIGISAKSNKIERVTEEENGYIRFIRNSDTDLYANYMSLQIVEKRFVCEFDIKPVSGNATVVLCLRDSASQNANAININTSSGIITTVNGNKTIGSVSKNEWTKVSLVFNINRNTFDLYINGELTAEKCKLPSVSNTWDNMNMIRWYVGTGASAEFGIDNTKIYAGKVLKDLDGADSEQKSILKYERSAQTGLYGSVSLHPDSDIIWVKDKKLTPSVKSYTKSDGSFMVGLADITAAFGFDGEIDGDEYSYGEMKVKCEITDSGVYVNLDEFVKAFKINKEVTERGLIVLNKYTSNISAGILEQMNDYLIYDHPTMEFIAKYLAENKLSHPYVLASHERFMYVKENYHTIPELKIWAEAVIKEADRNLTSLPVTYTLDDDGQRKRLLATSRKVYSRAKSLGMAYWLTGDKKYSDRLYLELDAVMNFPDWHPSHYLDTSEMAMAFAIGYDWAYDAWTDTQKIKMEEKIFEHCLSGYREKLYSSIDYDITSNTNRGIVNNAGPGVAALAFYSANPEMCAEIIENAIWGMDIPMRYFFPSGSWYEGPGYWSYTVDYLANFMSTVESAFGTDFGIYKAKGFLNTGVFAVYTSGGGKNKYNNNYHDTAYNSTGNTKSVVMLWLSSITKNPALQKMCIADRGGSPFSNASALIWCNLEAFDKGAEHAMPLDSYITGDEHISLRSSFEDTGATVVMAHGGVGDASHSHLDYGTFVVDIAGERWAIDMGSDNYGNTQLNSAKDGRYFSYRVSPAGHNTILFNPSDDYTGQDLDGFCEVEKFESDLRGSYAILDMTSGYKRDADRIRRGYMLTDDRRSVTIRDEATLKKSDSYGYWLCHLDTKDVEIIDDYTAILTKNGKKLKFTIATNARSGKLSLDEADYIEGFKNTKNSAEYSRDMFKRLTFKFEGAPKDVWVQAKFIALSDPASHKAMELSALDEWKIPDGELQTIPTLSKVIVEANPSFKFGPSETFYSVKCDSIENPPKVTAYAEDGIEISYVWANSNTYEISASKNGLTTKYTFEFSVPDTLPDINGKKRYPVYGVEVSATPEITNGAENLADGDTKTKWAASGDEQWATIDLGAVREVDALAISFLNGERIYSFDILVSNNNEDWETVYERANSSGTADIMEILDLKRMCRYIKYVGHGSNVNTWNNPSEIAALKE